MKYIGLTAIETYFIIIGSPIAPRSISVQEKQINDPALDLEISPSVDPSLPEEVRADSVKWGGVRCGAVGMRVGRVGWE